MNPLVSVVITSYNRPRLLKETVSSLLLHMDYEPIELILADDASNEDARRQMRELPFDKFCFAEKNSGLGANTNMGLAAAEGDYILQLQDDWRCVAEPEFLNDALTLFKAHPEVGFIKLTDRQNGLKYSTKTVLGIGDVRFYEHRGEKEKFYYSDNPHLKTRRFVEALGPYKESRYMQRTELNMRDRFLHQDEQFAAFMEKHNAFVHIGKFDSSRSLMPLAKIGKFMDGHSGLRTVAKLFRQFKRSAKNMISS